MVEAIEVCPICDITGCAHIREAGLKATIATQQERIQQLEAALADARSGLNYIRETHGELYGVGFDRVEKACAALLKENDNG